MDTEVLTIRDEGLGNSAYVLRAAPGVVAVVDPERDPSPYQQAARELGGEITTVFETHLHADFVSGSRELAARGATLVAPLKAGLEYAHRPIANGEEIEIGDVAMRALATRGHTPEHLAYLLLEQGTPRALFSGGALLAGSVARTDLIAPELTEPLLRDLYRSVRALLADLPDDLPLYPTHGAGSFCSTAFGGQSTSTLGRERESNPVFTIDDEDDFVARTIRGLGSFPRYFLRLREVNRRGPSVADAPPGLDRLSADEFRAAMADAQVIDARPIDRFGAGHIPGSLSISLRPAFASWLGWLVEPDTPLLFVLDADQDRADLVRQCRNIGYERLLGELTGGFEGWLQAGGEVASIPLVPADDLSDRLVDVRQLTEFEAGHIPGALHVELGSIATATLPDGPLTLACGHGERAMTAASVLEARGRAELSIMPGGASAWSRVTGRPLDR